MQRKEFLRTLIALTALTSSAFGAHAAGEDGLVVIANAPLHNLDAEALKRIYTGRTIEIDGQRLRPVTRTTGSPAQRLFLSRVLQQSEDEYKAYWTVRRYIGKGAPPREFASAAEVIAYVQHNPGAIGYLEAGELRPGLNVVFRH